MKPRLIFLVIVSDFAKIELATPAKNHTLILSNLSLEFLTVNFHCYTIPNNDIRPRKSGLTLCVCYKIIIKRGLLNPNFKTEN